MPNGLFRSFPEFTPFDPQIDDEISAIPRLPSGRYNILIHNVFHQSAFGSRMNTMVKKVNDHPPSRFHAPD
ncbi:MAG: hypothetical protein IT188_06355 [Acidobacteria bacterium]|jgi:hypothetical protein|nr:hypothetical protein [Acidobacteriota bacterium]HNT31112.1 hypothetical protein [Candidatus Aminicenantes bacterium]